MTGRYYWGAATPKEALLRMADGAEKNASDMNEEIASLHKRCAELTTEIAEQMKVSRAFREAAAKVEAA
jgi:hypothetical protein